MRQRSRRPASWPAPFPSNGRGALRANKQARSASLAETRAAREIDAHQPAGGVELELPAKLLDAADGGREVRRRATLLACNDGGDLRLLARPRPDLIGACDENRPTRNSQEKETLTSLLALQRVTPQGLIAKTRRSENPK